MFHLYVHSYIPVSLYTILKQSALGLTGSGSVPLWAKCSFEGDILATAIYKFNYAITFGEA